MGIFALHRVCADIISRYPEEPSGVVPTRFETVCGDGLTMEEARNNFNLLTCGRCFSPPGDVSVECGYKEEDTFLLRALIAITKFADWLGE